MPEDRRDLARRLERALDSIPPMDEAVVQILRRKTPAERLELCFAANRGLRALMEMAIRREHEEWTDAQVQREVAARMLALPDDFEMR